MLILVPGFDYTFVYKIDKYRFRGTVAVFMHLLRQASRKVSHDGVGALFSEIHERVFREKVLRYYVDASLDYDEDVVSVESIISNGSFSYLDSIVTERNHIPRKTRVGDDDNITNVSHGQVVPQQCAQFVDATVFQPTGLIRTQDGRFISDSVGPPHLSSRRVSVALSMFGYECGFNQLRSVFAGESPDPITHVDEAIVLMPLWPNYFHWTIECLLKLHWVERYIDSTGNEPTILVPPDLSSWMAESLSLLGYDDNDLWALESPAVHANRILIPSQIEPVPKHSGWLRNKMIENIDELKGDERIYISRKNATKRQVINEEELISALKTRGFRPYVLEELSVKEQVSLFAEAEVVVGPHGAGFANLIYASDPLVVELFGQKRLNTYHRLATSLEHQYEPIYCDAEGSDLRVDITKVINKLDEYIIS